MRQFLFSGFLILLMVSCKKDDNCLPFEPCIEEPSIADSALVVKKMIGNWTEQYRPCGWSGDSTAAGRKISIELRSDGSYVVRDHGKVYQQGKWDIYRFSNTPLTWMIRSHPGSSYISGKVVFCSDKLVFKNTFMTSTAEYDGCAKYYYRK